MFPGREDVEADLLDLLGYDDGALDAFCLGRWAACGRIRRHVTDGEDPELHACHSTGLS